MIIFPIQTFLLFTEIQFSYRYLDLYRDPKEIKKEVLLERLKSIDPFDYKKNFVEPKVPPAYHRYLKERRDYPVWYAATLFKKDKKLGPYRLLRNDSAILPLGNNADLDYPIWPFSEKHRLPMFYPYKNSNRKLIKDTKWVLPAKDHPHIREEDEDIHQVRRDELKEDLANLREVTQSVTENSK